MKWVLLLCLVTCAYAASRGHQTYSLEDAEVLFEKFIVDYNRQYANEQEKQTRFEIFKQFLMKVNSLNDDQRGNQVFGITKFSDYTVHELNKLKGLLPSKNTDDVNCNTIKTDDDIPDAGAPDSWDWRDQKAVTEVKDQGFFCGACYAFSATGSIEGQVAIKHKQLLSLSEQQIVACSMGQHGNFGCYGGLPSGAFRYLMEQGGSEKESDYPYAAIDGNCTFDMSKVVVKVTDCIGYNLKSQAKLKQLLYENGPISVGITTTDINAYQKGVIQNCEQGVIDHAVLLVGYGTDPAGGDYWLLKNSWGDWGEHGYFRIERGEGKTSCGMLNDIMASAIVA